MSNQQQPTWPRPSWFRAASLTRPLSQTPAPSSPPVIPTSRSNVAFSRPSSARLAFPPPTSSLPPSSVVKPAPPKLVGSTSPVSKLHPATSSIPNYPKSEPAALKNFSVPSPEAPLQLPDTKPTAQQPPSQFKPKFLSEGGEETLVARKMEENNPLDVSIITLAGDNRGAAMGLFRSPGKLGNLETTRGNSSGSGEEGEGERKSKAERRIGGWGRRGKGGVIVNSNVQGINNSIIFDSCCDYYDPGVHLTL